MRASGVPELPTTPSSESAGDILFLVHRIPFPPNKGDKIRSFHELKHLAAAGWKVHLCALADDPADLVHVPTLKEWCSSVFVQPISPTQQRWKSLLGPLGGRPLSVPYFYSHALQRRIDAVLCANPVDRILCFSGPMAEYVFRSSSAQLSVVSRQSRRSKVPVSRRSSARASPRLIMDLVDVDSDKWTQYAARKSWPVSWLYRLEGLLLARYEKRVADAFEATVLVSPAEAHVFRTRSGLHGKVHAVGNGVDLEYFHPSCRRSGVGDEPIPSETNRAASLVFCGAMDYYPNVDAVVWFTEEVLPLVRRAVGEVVFTVVGSKPTPEVLALRGIPGVTVTGRVEDVRPHVWAADVSVAPIRVARGVQNKVLEAMAMGRPVVSTPEAFEGIEAKPGVDLIVAEAEPGAFAAAIVDLLRNPAKARGLGTRGRGAVERCYGWDRQLRGLHGLMVGIDTVEERGAIVEGAAL